MHEAINHSSCFYGTVCSTSLLQAILYWACACISNGQLTKLCIPSISFQLCIVSTNSLYPIVQFFFFGTHSSFITSVIFHCLKQVTDDHKQAAHILLVAAYDYAEFVRMLSFDLVLITRQCKHGVWVSIP